MKGVAKSKLRKAVTGDPDKKIRDYMTEVPQVLEPPASKTSLFQCKTTQSGFLIRKLGTDDIYLYKLRIYILARSFLTVHGPMLCTVRCTLCTLCPVHTTDHVQNGTVIAALLVISH